MLKSNEKSKLKSEKLPLPEKKNSKKNKSADTNRSNGIAIRPIKSLKKISKKPAKKSGFSSAHPEHVAKLFPIVAIGASAGGLEAYKILLNNMSSDTGMAFVIIQHLSPDYKSMLKEILSRETSMEVRTVKNGLKPIANTVYLAPPAHSVSFVDGVFHLSLRSKVNKSFLPIDIFMKSLADNHQHYSIGIILSGTDSDGVKGMECIKARGGLTFAQDLQTAKFNDMPRNSINAGVVDFVLSPDAMARELKRVSRNFYLNLIHKPEISESLLPHSESQIKNILIILQQAKNIDFKQYKPATISRRILRRMLLHKFTKLKEYAKFLSGNNDEIDLLCEDILINVTNFFRDPQMFESLKENVFPKIMKGRKNNESLRIWITACSSGEEAYSLAIALMEYLGNKVTNYKIQIFSTDLSEPGIAKARVGIYSADIKYDVSGERLRKFFTKIDNKYQINKNIRELCIFAKQNLIQDPPFSKIDVISCRNVLIYLGQVLQKKLLPVFHYALKQSGYLILGPSETIGTFKNLFDLIDRKNRIYHKRPGSSVSEKELHLKELFTPKMRTILSQEFLLETRKNDLQNETDNRLLKKYPLNGVVINKDMDIVRYRGTNEVYLETREGTPTNNLFKLASKGLGSSLKLAINEARKKKKSVRKNNIQITYYGSVKNINLIIEPFSNNDKNQQYFLVMFEDADKKAIETKGEASNKNIPGNNKDVEIARMNKALELNRDHLQAVEEQQETTTEELRTANEEIQSSNEELQSTNEELETTKEELQSTNEELTTVNEELQNRNQELSLINSDLTNLLSSIKISIIMLDNGLRIQRYTNESTKLFNIIPSDIGRKISDISGKLDIKNIKHLVNNVIDTRSVKEVEVTDSEGSCYSMKIRPYKTVEKKIDGVLITFVDITDIKISLKELAKTNKSLELEVIERKNAETSLRDLSKNLVEGQEAERLKLSRDLHDGINQILSAAQLKMLRAENELKSLSVNNKKIKTRHIIDAKSYLIKAIEEIRRLAHDLRPATLDDIGMVAAVKTLVEEFKIRNKITVNFSVSKLKKRLSQGIELTLYRVVQESLQNIEKHAKASVVKIILTGGEANVKMIISDNGKGFQFPVKKISGKKRGLGLINLRERAQAVNGKFDFKSERNIGTKVELVIPIRYKNDEVRKSIK